MGGLPDEKNLSLDKSESNITLTSWISWIRFYTEDTGMDTVFCVYDTDLKTEVYLLDEWGASEDRKASKWVQTLTTMGVGAGKLNCLSIYNFD